jgi:NAD(P)-dependent dehydrogenase (short-subunit alcohol dehydrogenase family)
MNEMKERTMTSADKTPVPDYPGFLRLDGRNIIVAGAGRGMGRHTSHALTQCGAKVLCVDIVEELAHEIAAEVNGSAFVGDMRLEADIEHLMEHARSVFDGPVSGFVDIIGIADWVEVIDTDEKAWDEQFDVCLRHAFLLSKHVGREMVNTGTKGTMVFIASVNGMTGSTRHAAYGAAKAGIISLVKTLTDELGGRGIRANAIAPGTILTPRMEIALDDALRAQAAAVAPMNRMGIPPEIASAALFLTSDLSSYITGHTLVVDGGVVARDPWRTGL